MLLQLILLFIFGTAVGSFLNVLIARLPNNQGITGWSRCPRCKHRLFARDLIPLFSFVFLRSRCRYCGEKISVEYPLVELITGLSFALLGSFWLLSGLRDYVILAFVLVIVSSAIVLFFIDLKHKIVPESVVLAGVVAAICLRFVETGGLLVPLMSGLSASGFFLVLHLAGRVFSSAGWMGFGDVELAFLVGLVSGWPLVVVSLFFSFLTGALVSITLVLKKDKKFTQTVPFGPFLILGTIAALSFGRELLTWYLSFI